MSSKWPEYPAVQGCDFCGEDGLLRTFSERGASGKASGSMSFTLDGV